jgi:hypothetical protein
VDARENAYITGGTNSANFPTTPGAYQTSFGGNGQSDAFVSKLDATGSRLVYSTYLGGSGYDFGQGIAIDDSGNAYVTGQTYSANFPTTTGAYQTSQGGTGDNVFVSKLDASGSTLVYSTYMGNGMDDGIAIAIDGSGNAYITGTTQGGFPITASAFQSVFCCSGGFSHAVDAFVTEINASGSRLVYSTYLGDNAQGIGIAVDGSGNIYVTGETGSDFPVTADAYQTRFGGSADAFMSKLNPSLNGAASLVYSTYVGGSGADSGNGIAVDRSGNAYVVGNTNSPNLPSTSGAYQLTFGGNFNNAFVSKFAS